MNTNSDLFSILLINPSARSFGGKSILNKVYPAVPPIALAMLAAPLEQSHFRVQIFDMCLPHNTEDVLFDLLVQKSFKVIGFSVLTSVANVAFELSAKIKKQFPDIQIVWGNIHASLFANSLLDTKVVDFVIHGEGEIPFHDLCISLRDKTTMNSNIAGVESLTIKGGGLKANCSDLNTSTKPALHLFDLDAYCFFPLFAIHNQRFMLVSGSRGCPFRCYFCAQDIMTKIPRYKDMIKIVDDIEWMYEQHGILQFIFADAFFPHSIDQGMSFCDEMIRRGLHKKIKWTTETRVDLVSYDLLKKMKAAGLSFIMFGLESSSQRTLNLSNKKVESYLAEKVIGYCRELKIASIGLFIIGFPWEKKEDCEETIRFAKKVGCDIAKFNTLIPYPGTKYYDDIQIRNANFDSFDTWKNLSHSSGECELPGTQYLSRKELIELQRKGMISFYLRPSVFYNLFSKGIINLRTLFWGGLWILGMIFRHLKKMRI